MYVTCNMFLMHCFDFNKSLNDFSSQKVHLFKTKIIQTAENEPYQWVGLMVSSVLHYILGCEACELHFCTMRPYCKHDFIHQTLTGSHIRAFVFLLLC